MVWAQVGETGMISKRFVTGSAAVVVALVGIHGAVAAMRGLSPLDRQVVIGEAARAEPGQ